MSFDPQPQHTESLTGPVGELKQLSARAVQLLETLDLGAGTEGAMRTDLLNELQMTQFRLSRVLDGLERQSQTQGAAQGAAGQDLAAKLERRVAALEAENEDLTERLVSLENRSGQMMKMFVATYQLYAGQDAEEVQATIGEIAVDLLGAERFVLLWSESEGSDCRIAIKRGLESVGADPFAGDQYRGGIELVDTSLEDGVLRLSSDQHLEDPQVLAVVPLRVQSMIAGALVLIKLFDHKPALSAGDREILDLLAAHAASALFAAKAYALTARKLHSLESLVRLLRGGT